MGRKSIVLLCACLMLGSLQAMELAVIVHPSNKVVLSQEQLQLLLLNKQRFMTGGQKIHMLHQPSRSAAHQWICRQLLDLTPAQYQSYWSRLLFTGNADALQYMESNEVLQKVATDPDALGYLPLSEVTPQVRVLGVLTEQGFQSKP